jgi:hypothetical protein
MGCQQNGCSPTEGWKDALGARPARNFVSYVCWAAALSLHDADYNDESSNRFGQHLDDLFAKAII